MFHRFILMLTTLICISIACTASDNQSIIKDFQNLSAEGKSFIASPHSEFIKSFNKKEIAPDFSKKSVMTFTISKELSGTSQINKGIAAETEAPGEFMMNVDYDPQRFNQWRSIPDKKSCTLAGDKLFRFDPIAEETQKFSNFLKIGDSSESSLELQSTITLDKNVK